MVAVHIEGEEVADCTAADYIAVEVAAVADSQSIDLEVEVDQTVLEIDSLVVVVHIATAGCIVLVEA